MKILPQMYLWTTNNWLNFGSHRFHNQIQEFFWPILEHYEIGHFKNGSYPWTKWSDLHTSVSWKKEVAVKFGSHPVPDFGSGVRNRIWTPDTDYACPTWFSLVEVCGIWLLWCRQNHFSARQQSCPWLVSYRTWILAIGLSFGPCWPIFNCAYEETAITLFPV